MNGRRALLNDIDYLLDTYCDDCLLFLALKEEGGRASAYRFCLRQCTIGKKLQDIGKKLS